MPFAELVRNGDGVGDPERGEPSVLDLREARLGLTAVERQAVEKLVTGSHGMTADFVAQRAAALATDEDGSVRRRCLAKMLAIHEALSSQLAALLAAAVARRDADAVKLLDRALTGSVARFRLLTAELRAEAVGGRRAVVQVGVAQRVTITGER
jgi:hypothetical protein